LRLGLDGAAWQRLCRVSGSASSDRTDPRDASGGIAIVAIPIGAFCRRGGAVEATRLRNEIVQFLLRNFHTQNIIC